MIFDLLRPLLYRMDPERAHSLTLSLLKLVGEVSPLGSLVGASLGRPRPTPVETLGLEFSNPVGLAAGYDKDGLAWRGLARLGFGHVEVGTVTPRPQPGNPRPRVFRLIEQRSLINRLGFPSRGAEFVARQLGGDRPAGLVLGVNLGKQKTTPLVRAVEDYELLVDRFAPLADYLAINVSSPNTPELRTLQQREWLGPLLARLVSRTAERALALGRRVPLLVKLSPDLTDVELAEAVETVEAAGVDGIIATNTTVARGELRSRVAREAGGLSGAALTARSTAVVRRIRERSGLPIVASGGIMGVEDARAKLEAGASLLQIYTGLVYEGPALVRRLVDGLRADRA